MSQLPPMLSGRLPIVGHAAEMQRNQERLFKRGYEEHGDVFAIQLGKQPIAVVTGAEHNRKVYAETDKALNVNEALQFVAEAFGEVLLTAPKEIYENQRPLLQALFSRQRMVGYVQAMEAEVGRWLAGLKDIGRLNITEEMTHLTQYVAAHAFIGAEFRSEIEESFWQHYTTLALGLDPLLPSHWPLPKFKARDKAREQIRTMLYPVLQRRRQNPEQYDDPMLQITSTPLRDETMLSDDEIVDLFLGLLFAGHETTAGQAAWLIILLLQHPAYLQKMLAEIEEYAPAGQPLDGGVMRNLKHVYWAVDETTRLRPSAPIGIRIVKEPIVFDEYTIPIGWQVMTSSYSSHHAQEVFTNPEQFDPLRYSPEHREGSAYDIIGFGGGRHKCTGMNFARNEMAVIVTRLFQQFDLQLLTSNPEVINGLGAAKPSDTWLSYRRK